MLLMIYVGSSGASGVLSYIMLYSPKSFAIYYHIVRGPIREVKYGHRTSDSGHYGVIYHRTSDF
jgi:hypothetical protein